jgi:hypothetical protein
MAGLAGCGGSTNDESEEQGTTTDDGEESSADSDSTDGESEPTAQALKNVRIDIDNITYGFGGITNKLRLVNEKEQEETRNRVQVTATAYSDGETIGETSLYETFTYAEDIELTIESVSEMGDYDLSDVTKYTISGRITSESDSSVVVHDFDNEELRTEIEQTGDTQ